MEGGFDADALIPADLSDLALRLALYAGEPYIYRTLLRREWDRSNRLLQPARARRGDGAVWPVRNVVGRARYLPGAARIRGGT